MRNPVALHVRITDAAAALDAIIQRAEDEIPEKKRNPHGGFGSGKGGHGPLAAWNSQAALWILEVHQGLRETEQNLAYGITGRLRDQRGGSDRNTRKILSSLPSLAAGADYAVAMDLARKLERWAFRGRLILGEIEPLARLPRLPGQPDPACPFCKSIGTLRVRHATGVVVCLKPSCRDSDGNRPQGRIEIGAYSGEAGLAWSDGTSGVAAA